MDDPELYKTKVKYILENDIEEMDLTFSEEEYSPEGHLIKVCHQINNMAHFLWQSFLVRCMFWGEGRNILVGSQDRNVCIDLYS